MGLFFRDSIYKNKILVAEVTNLMSKVSSLELEMEKLKGHMLSLRGYVNRSKQLKELPVEEEQQVEEETPETKVLLDPNGNKIK